MPRPFLLCLILVVTFACVSAQPVVEPSGHVGAEPTQPRALDATPFFTALSVSNIEVSSRWYQAVFGLQVARTIDAPEYGARVHLLANRNSLIELIEDSGAATREALLPDLERRTHIHGFFKAGVQVPSLDAAIATLEDLEIELRGRVITEDDGSMRSAQIEDPDGNVWQIFEDLAYQDQSDGSEANNDKNSP